MVPLICQSPELIDKWDKNQLSWKCHFYFNKENVGGIACMGTEMGLLTPNSPLPPGSAYPRKGLDL